MTPLSIDAVAVGDPLPARAAPAITKARIVDVMTVMDDVNPVHVDEALAASLGLRGIVVKSHGSADRLGFRCALERAAEEARRGLIERITAHVETLAPADA